MPARSTSSSALLRALADAVDRLGEGRVRSILADAGRADEPGQLRFGSGGTKKRNASAAVRLKLVRSLAEQLQSLDSLEAGEDEFRKADLSRRELESLARSFDVPVRKDINQRDLETLLLNVTIGGRLNSRAIRGD
jgi:hypothetical protein